MISSGAPSARQSDRLIVLSGGEKVGELDRDHATAGP